MKFIIPVSYTMVGEFEVEADSLQRAIEIVEDGDTDLAGINFECLPSDAEYLDDSFEVDKQSAQALVDG